MTTFGLDLWGAAFQAVSFLCLMAIPWTDDRARIFVIVVAAAGILTILIFQFYIGVESDDYGLGGQLMIVTLSKAALYFCGSWIVERLFRLYLIKRRGKNPPPPS